MNTATINGLTVLAKPDNSPLTYGNLTAAQKKADSLSSLTESWEGRKVDGYRFCVVLLAQEAHDGLMLEALSYHNPAYDGPDSGIDAIGDDGTWIQYKTTSDFDVSPEAKEAKRLASILPIPTMSIAKPIMDSVLEHEREQALSLDSESFKTDEDYLWTQTPRELIQFAGFSASRKFLRQAQRELKSFFERERDRRLFWEASQIVESLRGIHSMDVIRFSPRSGSSAGKYTMRTLPRYGDNRAIQLPISREDVSLLVRAGFIRPGKRNRWKFVPEKLSQSLRYLGAVGGY